MGRPAKSAKVGSGKIGQDERDARQEEEAKIRGEARPPDPPAYLTQDQAEIFRFITGQLAASEILGKLDVYVLESTAVAIDRLHTIDAMVNKDKKLLSATALQNSRAKYQADLWRGCNELCLSPQARAKLGSLAAKKLEKEKDPLLEALMDDD